MPLKKSIIPNVVHDQKIRSLSAGDSAHHAANMMMEYDISAILIVSDDEKLIGIVTERDMTRKIVAKSLNAEGTTLEQIMTKNPRTLLPTDSVFLALEVMRDMQIRHLPITEGERIVGIVSMKDVRRYINHLPKDSPSLLKRISLPRRWHSPKSSIDD